MKSRTTQRFRTLLAELPAHVRVQARDAYRLFRTNPWHPGLRFKKVQAARSIYTVRIGLGYRAAGIFNGDTVVWFWVGSHADYDTLLEQL